MTVSTAKDRHGKSVVVGSRVRVLGVSASLLQQVPSDEHDDLLSMVGEVFEVYEIDPYGAAWVEKEWSDGSSGCHSHSLALAADEMEVVEATRLT